LSAAIWRPPEAAAVEVYALGGFRVLVGGRTLGADAWPRKTARQLFKYLLSRPYRRASREEAIEFLWPEGDPVTGAANLRPTLTALRHALRPTQLIATDREYISIRESPELWVDVDAFEDALAQLRAAEGDMELALLDAASRLYQGDYLPDDWFEEAIGRREALKRRWAPLHLKFARLQQERGDAAGAIRTLERLLQQDAADEDAALELMRLLAQAGRRADALRVFEQVKRHLAEQLDVEPSDRLVRMRERVTAQPASAVAPRAAEAPASSTGGVVAGQHPPPPSRTVILVQSDEPAALPSRDKLEHDIAVRGGQLFERPGRRARPSQYFGVVPRAGDAISLAGQLLRDLRPGGQGRARRLPRMAIHTTPSAPLALDDLDLAFTVCEHLAGAAHPGQVLLSAQSALAVISEGTRLAESTLLDLGDHRLAPDAPPERVYQLAFADQPDDFPPLASLNRLPYTLPRDDTRLIGRDTEVAEITALLRHFRVVTLTGPGGVGKTRLALHVAHTIRHTFADGACMVSLEAIADAELIAPAIAHRLGIVDRRGQFLSGHLTDFLRHRELLLVLDNFEHVAHGTGLIGRLVRDCPSLHVLITSQMLLDLDPEYGSTYEVPPLQVPGPRAPVTLADLQEFSAARMFVDRARAARSDFSVRDSDAEAVAEICRRLEGLPLAIVLAAARVRLMRPAEMTRLKSLLPLLAGGSADQPARQRTLRASIGWTFHLLTARTQVLFARLSTFAGGFSLEAAQQVCGIDTTEGGPEVRPNFVRQTAPRNAATESFGHSEGLSAAFLGSDVLDGVEELITSSLLVRRDEPHGSRYRMLETIREYAWEVLQASGEARAVQRRHAMYYRDLAQRAEPGLLGADQSSALTELAIEHENVRTALQWARSSEEGDLGLGLDLAASIWRFWLISGYVTDGRAWLEDALERRSSVDRCVLARARIAAGELACAAGDLQRGMVHAERSLALYRDMRDDDGIAHALHIRGYCLSSRAQTDADYLEAAAHHQECLDLERRRGHRSGIAKAQHALGEIARYRQHYDEARQRLSEAWQERARLGDSEGQGWSAHCIAWVEYERAANLHEALHWADRALSIWESFPGKSAYGISATRSVRARILLALGDRHGAAADLLESLSLWPLLRYIEWLIYDLEATALLALDGAPTDEGAYQAAVLLGATTALHDTRPAKHRRREPLRIWKTIRQRLGFGPARTARAAGATLTAEAAHAYASDIVHRVYQATGQETRAALPREEPPEPV
jgi:predicted ATPase/DNA-binding SARP family transcriptional activator